jgi:hypothetical protein
MFVSFDYQAPRNGIVAAYFVLRAFLISAPLHLILDMDKLIGGLISTTSNSHFQRVLEDFGALTSAMARRTSGCRPGAHRAPRNFNVRRGHAQHLLAHELETGALIAPRASR